MLKLLLTLSFFFINLYACSDGYNGCQQKIIDSHAIGVNTLQIPLLKNQKLIYSNAKPNANILKHDPFLNLYLIKDDKKFKHPFRTNYKLSLGSSAVTSKMVIEGKILKKQIGLNKFATFNETVPTPSLLLNSCCALDGLITPQGIIQKEYIDNFLNSKELEYGDIGVRVDDEKNLIIVQRVDPFDNSMKFKKGDCIISIDNYKVKNSAEFMRKILFSKLNKKIKVKIKRDSKFLTIDTTIKKRYGGGYISDTFLESKGLYFSDDLTILKIGDEFKKYGLLVGDKLLQVNSKEVSTIDGIRENIDDFKHFASLLFTRRNFQFFVNINKDI